MRRFGARRGDARVIGLFPLVLAIALVASGCTKITGGGWIQSDSLVEGEKATFGFTARCKDTTTTVGAVSVPTAILHDGQFEFEDHGLGVSVHGNVETLPLQEFPGTTCKQLRSEPNLLGSAMFAGTYRTQPAMTPAHEGEFLVQVFDSGKAPQVDPVTGNVLADEICVELAGVTTAFAYSNCGELQGGSLKVE
jgi:hypothetical protein